MWNWTGCISPKKHNRLKKRWVFCFTVKSFESAQQPKGLNSCDFGYSFKLLQKNKFRKRESAEISALSLFVGCACGRLCNGCAKTAAKKVKLKRRGETAVGANKFAPTAVSPRLFSFTFLKEFKRTPKTTRIQTFPCCADSKDFTVKRKTHYFSERLCFVGLVQSVKFHKV